MAVLALRGGTPVRSRPFPPWPIYGLRERRELLRVLRSRTWGTLGPRTRAFEEAFASYLGCEHAQTVANGTVSLEAILRALDVGPGDEVIVPPYTFIATATAVLMVGATPVFADVDPETNTIEPAAVEAAVTPRTRAVIPVHIAGIPADMDALLRLSERTGIPLIEDAAQAHGSEWRGRKLGTLGTAGSFSFQLSKNMSAGEGGAVTTNDEALAARVWSIHHVGRRPRGLWYGHYELASNYRMTDWQAGVLLAQLSRLDRQIDLRERNAARLDRSIAEIPGLQTFRRDERATRVTHHLYMFRYTPEAIPGVTRDRFVEALEAEGVPCSTGYVEIQRQPLFSHPSVRRVVGNTDYSAVSLPGAEKACAQTVWIAQNVLLGSDRDIKDVVRAVRKVIEHADELREGS